MKIGLSLVIIILSLLGIADASYLTYEKMSGQLPPCGPGFDCGQVLNSPWAQVGPIPLSALGLVYYTIIFMLAIKYYLDDNHTHWGPLRLHTHLLLWLTSATGIAFSGFLVFLMAVVIQAWCLYCVFSAIISSGIFMVASVLLWLNQSDCRCSSSWLRRSVFALLYQWGLKPILFALDAEFVHTAFINLGHWLGQTTAGRWLMAASLGSWWYHPGARRVTKTPLAKTVAGLPLVNPVGLAAGFDYNAELPDILPALGFGFATLGTVTLDPYEGNTPPRLARLPRSQALLVNKGFKSPGARQIIHTLAHRKFAIPIGISIGSTNRVYRSFTDQITNVVECFRLFERSAVKHSYYELNISCPNTTGGQPFTTPDKLKALLVALDKLKVKRPIFVKMPIDLSEAVTLSLLQVVDKHDVVGVIFGNLTKDKTNPDVHPLDRQKWYNMAGNLSGKPTWHRSNALIALTKRHFGDRLVIIGTGGIFSSQDAAHKLSLGADLVQLISGMVYQGPQLIPQIVDDLPRVKSSL